MAKIRAVAFDANGVLYYREAEVVDSVIEAARGCGCLLPADARERYVKLMNEAFGGKMSRPEMVEAILDNWDLTDLTQRQRVSEAISAASRVIRLYPGVLTTLARLRALGIGAGVITNTFQSAAEKWSWFERHGIAPYLERIISSIEVGVAKPDPAIYRLYVEACGLSPAEVAFVGHDRNELLGAERAGLVCLAFRPDQPGAYQPEFHDFADLIVLIGAGEADA